MIRTVMSTCDDDYVGEVMAGTMLWWSKRTNQPGGGVRDENVN